MEIVPQRDVPGFRHVLDPQVDRVDEAARCGQVGRGLHRRLGLCRVQRVDQDEPGALGGSRFGQHGQVVKIADAPGRPRAHRVQLRHQAPASVKPIGGGEPLRGDHQRALRLAAGRRRGMAGETPGSGPVGCGPAGSGLAGWGLVGSGLGHLECVPAQREVGRHHRGEAITRNTHCLVRPADHHLDVAPRPVLQHDLHPGAGTRAHIDRHLSGVSLADDDGGRQRALQRREFRGPEGDGDIVVGLAGDTQRGEDSNQRCRADRLLSAVPTAESSADAVFPCEALQRRELSHGPNLREPPGPVGSLRTTLAAGSLRTHPGLCRGVC